MNIEITLLNVKDGDAIIVKLKENKRCFIALIDGGLSSYSALIISELDKILSGEKKSGPDLVICTHYDSDHIGGLKAVVNNYKRNIGEIWMYRTQALKSFKKNNKKVGSSMFPSATQKVYRSAIISNSMRKTLESIKQESDLIALIDSLGIPSREPLTDDCPIKAWPAIKLLGPNKEYYLKNFPHKNKGFLSKTFKASKVKLDKTLPLNPCEFLNNVSIKNVTPVNLCSAVIMITIGDKKFLFTGDAGVPSFQAIKNYKQVLANLFWLKVPHHASCNNISCELIDIMKPKNAFVSGDKRISPLVIEAFKERKIHIETTRDSNSHLYFKH